MYLKVSNIDVREVEICFDGNEPIDIIKRIGRILKKQVVLFVGGFFTQTI